MLRHALTGDIWRPSDSGNRHPDPRICIKCVDVRETMASKFCFHVLDGISFVVHPAAQIDIPTGTVGEFITHYLTPDGWRNIIIGQCSVNGSIQFTGFPKIWGNSLPYIPNTALPYATRGWGWTTDIHSTNYTSTIHIPSYTGNWGRNTNASPALPGDS